MPAGYSGTPLMKKLGIDQNTRVLVVHAPDNYFELLESDISRQYAKKSENPDLVHIFAGSRKEMEQAIFSLKNAIKASPNIVIWVSWYKKSAGIPTDLTENHIRDFALSHGLVDIKVCAVSEKWSGLKLVVPRKLRN
jgi:hypothetical protein